MAHARRGSPEPATAQRIDVLHDSLNEATRKARATAELAELAAQVAREAALAQRKTERDLRSALRTEAHASAVVSRTVRLMNASPVGTVIAVDPMSAGLLSAGASPESYVQQSAELTGLSQSISRLFGRAATNVSALESAQVEALARQAATRLALEQAQSSAELAVRNQRLAKLVFLRVVGSAGLDGKEAWWVDQFAASGLGQLMARLGGGPVFDLRFTPPTNGVVTSPFGMRRHPILEVRKLHSGTDFSGGDGVIRAAAPGRVVSSGLDVAYGNYVVVYHGETDGDSVATLYAHCSSLRIKTGEWVDRGQPIAEMGATGYATGPHLHFEVRLEGRPVDPEVFLPR
jgi:murein DD-endopeptidase MepM/ murein hydrolase activator NlpD